MYTNLFINSDFLLLPKIGSRHLNDAIEIMVLLYTNVLFVFIFNRIMYMMPRDHVYKNNNNDFISMVFWWNITENLFRFYPAKTRAFKQKALENYLLMSDLQTIMQIQKRIHVAIKANSITYSYYVRAPNY